MFTFTRKCEAGSNLVGEKGNWKASVSTQAVLVFSMIRRILVTHCFAYEYTRGTQKRTE